MGEAQSAVVRLLAGPDERAQAFALREQVFYGEQGVPREEDLDGLDEQALHVVAIGPGSGRAIGPAQERAIAPEQARVIGTLRVVIDGTRAKVGRVVVQRDWRGRGIASRMLELALAEARQRGCEQVRLASQLQVVPLYECAGFAVESEPFEEAGIPHVWMGLRLGGGS